MATTAKDWIEKGNEFQRNKKYEEAIEYYEKAAQLDPNDVCAFHNCGKALFELAKINEDESLFEKAFAKYEEAVKLYETDDNKSTVFDAWGYALHELAKIKPDESESLFKKAIAKYEDAIKRNSKNFWPVFKWGVTLYELAKINESESLFKKAIAKYEDAIKLNSKNFWPFVGWGIALYELAKIKPDESESLLEEAIAKYKEAKELNPNYLNTFFKLGITLYALAEIKKDKDLYIKEAVEYFIKSKKDILSIFVDLYRENKKQIFEIKDFYPFYPLLNSQDINSDSAFFNKITESIKEDEIKLNEYKDIYLRSIFIISLLHINNEKLVAHYCKKDISQILLFDNKSKFRLNAINYSNDTSEGKALLEFLCGKEKCPTDEELNIEFEAFAGCFSFNCDSLNQFRLYGREDGNKEGTGLSLVFRDSFFSKKANMALNVEQISSNNMNNEKEKFSLYRCIYIDPQSRDNQQPIVTIGQKEESPFYRENKGNDFEKHNNDMKEIIDLVRKEMDKLKNQVKDLDYATVGKLLLNLRYLVKHIAFKEEQECRIVKIRPILNDNIKNDSKQMYIDRIYFGPKATNIELFKSMLKNKKLDIPCEKSTNPLA